MSSTPAANRRQRGVFGSRGGNNKRFKKAEVVEENKKSVSTSKNVVRSTNAMGSPGVEILSQSSAEESKLSQSPSTPKKKISRFTTPNSSPSSQIDLSNDIFNLLSPKKKKYEKVMESASKSQKYQNSSPSRFSTEDDGEDVSESSQTNFVSRPSKLAFASRMAPRKAKEVLEESLPALGSANYAPSLGGQSETSSRKSPIKPSRRLMREEDLQTFDDEIFSLGGSSSKSNSMNESQKSGFGAFTAEAEEDEKTEEVKDWKNLEEMEEEDGKEAKNAMRSIVNLRSSGTNMRSTEEIDYLLQGLNAKNRLGARKVTCLEIVKLLMGAAEEENDGHDVTLLDDWKPLPTHSNRFFLGLRRANVITHLLNAMIKAGAGRGEDLFLDTCLALAFFRIMEGFNLEDGVCRESGFFATFKTLIEADYGNLTSILKKEKKLPLIQLLALKCGVCKVANVKLLPSSIMLHVLVGILSTSTDMDESHENSRPSPQFVKGISLLRSTLWNCLNNSLKYLKDNEIDCHFSRIQMTCLASSLLYKHDPSNESFEKKEASTLRQLVDWLVTRIDSETQTLSSASVESLSAVLRFMITSIHQDKNRICQIFLSESNTIVNLLVFVIIKSTKVAQKTADDDDGDGKINVQLLDLAALALSILTDFLQREREKTIDQLWFEQEDPMLERGAVTELSSLYWQVSKENDEHSKMFSGCIAFFLALLLLDGENEIDEEEGKDDNDTRDESNENQDKVQASIIEGMRLYAKGQSGGNVEIFYLTLTNSLDHLENLTSNIHPVCTITKDSSNKNDQEERIIRKLSNKIRKKFL